MNVNNNANSSNSTSKVQLKPVASNISFTGTTVSYGISGAGASSINAFNNSYSNSDNWANTQTTNQWASNNNACLTSGNWSNAQTMNQWASTANSYPTVSASNYNQSSSGMHEQGNQYNNQYNNQLNKQFNQQFNNQLNYATNVNQGQLLQPSVDISETSNDIVISAYVSNGVMDDLSLNVSEDSVTISGSVWTGKQGVALRRIIPLATSIRAEACDASLQSGTLEIRLPKTEKMSRNKPTLTKDASGIK